jgi:DNA-directed RNA polymerase subunit M/transcription elongation factor TFIIS
LKSEADARRAKSILDAKFIASCLGPDDIAGLENFKGSFAGGVDLKVFPEDRLPAVRLLNEYAPDLMEWDDESEHEAELDYAVTCPKCQSEDIVLDEANAQPEDEKFLDNFRWTCTACGHQWQDEGISGIMDNNARGHSSSTD